MYKDHYYIKSCGIFYWSGSSYTNEEPYKKWHVIVYSTSKKGLDMLCETGEEVLQVIMPFVDQSDPEFIQLSRDVHRNETFKAKFNSLIEE